MNGLTEQVKLQSITFDFKSKRSKKERRKERKKDRKKERKKERKERKIERKTRKAQIFSRIVLK